MVQRAHPEQYFSATNRQAQNGAPATYYVTCEYAQPYIPKEVWVLLGIAVIGLIVISVYAIRKGG